MSPYVPAFYIQGNEFPTKLKTGIYDKIYKKYGTQFYFESARGITLIPSEKILLKYIERFQQNKLRPCFQLTENAEISLWRKQVINKKQVQKLYPAAKNTTRPVKKVDECLSGSGHNNERSTNTMFSTGTDVTQENAYDMQMFPQSGEDVCITTPIRRNFEDSIWGVLDVLFPNSNVLLHYGPLFVIGFFATLEAILYPAIDLLGFIVDKLREQEIVLCINGRSFELRNALNFVPLGSTLPPPYFQHMSDNYYSEPSSNMKGNSCSHSDTFVSSSPSTSCTCTSTKSNTSSKRRSYRSLWREIS